MTEGQKKNERGYRKEMSTWTAMFLAVGAILGPAIAFSPVQVLGYGGPSGVIAWIVALLLIYPLAMIYAEMGTMWPRGGGLAYYPLESNGPLVGVLNGWGNFFGYTLAVPSIVVALVDYLGSVYAPLTASNGNLTTLGIIVTIVTLLIIFVINNFRIKHLGTINNIMTILTIILIIVFAGAFLIHYNPANFNRVEWNGVAPLGASGFFIAITATIYGYGGFRHPVDYAEEVKDPGRSIPRAVSGTMIIVAIIYIVESLAFLGVLAPSGSGFSFTGDWSSLAFNTSPYVDAAKGFAGPAFVAVAIVALIATLIASFKDGVLFFGGGSRVGHNMARDGRFFPPTLSRMNKVGIPIATNVLVLVISIIFILIMPSFKALALLVAVGLVISYMPGALSVAIFRKVFPDEKRPYKIPLVKLSSPFSFAIASLLVFWSGWEATLVIVAAMFVGLIFLIEYQRGKGLQPGDIKYGIWLPIFLLAMLAVTYFDQFYLAVWYPNNGVFFGTAIFVAVSLIFYYWGYYAGIAYHKNRKVKKLVPIEEDENLA